MKRAIGLLLLAAAACNSAEPPPASPVTETVRLTPQGPAAELAVPPGNAGKVLVEVTRVDNPELREVTLIVSFEGENGDSQRFSFYPPDRPARIAVRVPEGARRMQVRIESRDKLPALVEVRALPFPR